MEQRPLAYMGSEPHVFISYAHKDSQIIYPIIERLHQKCLRQDYAQALEWYQKAYNNGIAEAEKHIEKCNRQLNKPNWWPF